MRLLKNSIIQIWIQCQSPTRPDKYLINSCWKEKNYCIEYFAECRMEASSRRRLVASSRRNIMVYPSRRYPPEHSTYNLAGAFTPCCTHPLSQPFFPGFFFPPRTRLYPYIYFFPYTILCLLIGVCASYTREWNATRGRRYCLQGDKSPGQWTAPASRGRFNRAFSAIMLIPIIALEYLWN